MKPTEHSAQKPSPRTGFFATLRAFLPGRGSGAPSSSPCRRLSAPRTLSAALTAAAVVAGLLLTATHAPAASAPPTVPGKVTNIKATRVNATMIAATASEFSIEVSTSSTGPWIFVANAQYSSVLHLKPATAYYLRFFAANSAGSNTAVVPFTTHPPEAPEIGRLEFGTVGPTHLAVKVTSFISLTSLEANGADTKYSFEYTSEPANPASWQPATEGATGTVTAEEDSAEPEARFTGLTPETTYSVRLKAENAVGHAEQVEAFRTSPASPVAEGVRVFDLAADAAAVTGNFITRGFQAPYRIEYAPAEAGGGAPPPNSPSWLPVPGASGTFPAVPPSELFTTEEFSFATAVIPGLSPATVYYARDFLENGHPPASTSAPTRFETAGSPQATTFATHAIHGESIRALGSVDAHTALVDELQTVSVEGEPTGGTFTLSFQGHTTAALPFNATSEAVRDALRALPGLGQGNVEVTGNRRGPYAVIFVGSLAGVDQPQLTCDASALTPPSATCSVATLLNGHSYDTRYRFQYVTEEHFKAEGFANASQGPELDLGAGGFDQGGFVTQVVGQDLPELEPGRAYRYRLLASNDTPGNPEVHASDQPLAVPVPGKAEAGEEVAQPSPCPNQALRSGPSANLPDCRAYEQVTPADKGGAQDLSTYGTQSQGANVGEDGDHFYLHAPGVQYGQGPDPKIGDYFFSRRPGGAWQMTSPRPPGETGPNSFAASLFSPDLTRIGLQAGWNTAASVASENVEYELGSPGGPYIAAVSVPRKQVGAGRQQGWVAGTPDLSKLVLAVEDRTLAGHPTGTKQGADLYEYSAGQLRQLNVSTGSPGTTIGTCGAGVVSGHEAVTITRGNTTTSPHAVSADGSRVFFEAAPGECATEAEEELGGPRMHLYMRTGGAETTDIGAYKLLAANRQGTKLLLEHPNGAAHEVLLFDTETHTATPLLTLQQPLSSVGTMIVSEDFTAFYFSSSQQLPGTEAPPTEGGRHDIYRYDLSTQTLSFGYQIAGGGTNDTEVSLSPDGRYFYIGTSVLASPAVVGLPATKQVYRYDSATRVVQCMSCASPYDPEPALLSTFLESPIDKQPEPTPAPATASADGHYAFFDTAAALLPADIDGEVAPEPQKGGLYTLSSDVYEWRANGVDGCAHIQGCLALISGGRGGYKTELLGTTPSGHDVFFSTHEALGPADLDTAGDIYDARIGGGQAPPPPRPVECEGDACSTPFAPPNDLTPSSSTFQGAGNVLGATLPEVKGKPKPKKVKPKKKKKTKKKGGSKKRGRRASAKRAVHAHHGGVK